MFFLLLTLLEIFTLACTLINEVINYLSINSARCCRFSRRNIQDGSLAACCMSITHSSKYFIVFVSHFTRSIMTPQFISTSFFGVATAWSATNKVIVASGFWFYCQACVVLVLLHVFEQVVVWNKPVRL